MKNFTNPSIDVNMIAIEDIITTSPLGGNPNITPEVPGGED